MPYEEVGYWPEILDYLQWADTHVFSTLHFCWAAQAGLYRDYGIAKRLLDRKLFGIYQYSLTVRSHPLLRGFDDRYFIPQSRHTAIDDQAVDHCLIWKFYPVLKKMELILYLTIPVGESSFWDILNTMQIRWNGNINGIMPGVWKHPFLNITILEIIPRIIPGLSGAAMPICFIIIG